jgi:hypothetical protein
VELPELDQGSQSDYPAEELANWLKPFSGSIWRVVETQEIAATRSITSSAAEQSRLEFLLESSKPKLPIDCQGLDYLLASPFRYPPLDYGSRFGTASQRGVFYGSRDRRTAFAESAVYLWLFRAGPITTGPLEQIRGERTLFSVRVESAKALDLGDELFAPSRPALVDAASWARSQQLGTAARAADVEVILYPSARIVEGSNAALFAPAAFADRRPRCMEHWQMHLNGERCWFGQRSAAYEFRRLDFERDGDIPHPGL